MATQIKISFKETFKGNQDVFDSHVKEAAKEIDSTSKFKPNWETKEVWSENSNESKSK